MLTIESGLEEGQVLQRQGVRGANISLVGRCLEKSPVRITITGRTGALKDWSARPLGQSQNGWFRFELKGIPVGGPYRLTLRAGKMKASRKLFFVGDVWLMAGQSNMEGCGRIIKPTRPNALIRTFSMRREWRIAVDPLHLLAESPDACHGARQCLPKEGEILRKTAQTGTGVGIFFAREMLRRTRVPQGLIATAHGGTSLMQWSPKAKAMGAGSLYGSMLLAIRSTGQSLAGVLWYQGENETSPGEAPLYTERMKQLVAAVRRDLQLPRLPWVMVQLSRSHLNSHGPSWNAVQEQQRLLPAKIGCLETIVSIDLPLDDSVHIGSEGFPRLGSRMAQAARYLAGKMKKRPPQLKAIRSMRNSASGPCVEVHFDSIQGQLRATGLPHGFTVVNSDGKPLPIIYKTTLHGKCVRLHCSRSLLPEMFLHHGWGLTPLCNIVDGRGFPLPVFGPLPIFKPTAYLPFIKVWRTSGVVPTDPPLARMACPGLDCFGALSKIYDASPEQEGFINEHQLWQGRSGLAYFTSSLQLSEPMKLDFLLGYDGPFRLWINGKSFFTDLRGASPCLADQRQKRVSLSSGNHRITIAMDLKQGLAWGFFLRFIRNDVSVHQIATGNYLRPIYSV